MTKASANVTQQRVRGGLRGTRFLPLPFGPVQPGLRLLVPCGRGGRAVIYRHILSLLVQQMSLLLQQRRYEDRGDLPRRQTPKTVF